MGLNAATGLCLKWVSASRMRRIEALPSVTDALMNSSTRVLSRKANRAGVGVLTFRPTFTSAGLLVPE